MKAIVPKIEIISNPGAIFASEIKSEKVSLVNHQVVSFVIASAIGASGINALDADGATPLFLSVAFGSLNVFRVFLKYGGDVNGPGYEGYSILHAAECGFAAFPNSERE